MEINGTTTNSAINTTNSAINTTNSAINTANSANNGNSTTTTTAAETVVPKFHMANGQSGDTQDWKIWARRALYITYFSFMLLIIPVMIFELVHKGADLATIIWFLAGMATIFAVPISLWGILNHLIYFTQPKLQRHIIR